MRTPRRYGHISIIMSSSFIQLILKLNDIEVLKKRLQRHCREPTLLGGVACYLQRCGKAP
eukprot:7053267-Karenia_brevis.AAC.1